MRDPRLPQQHAIKIAFHHDGEFPFHHRVLGLPQPIQLSAFRIERRFGAVQIFGLLSLEAAPPKPHDPPARVDDRKRHALPKPIDQAAG